jgi:hypothetical protein
MVEKLQTHLVLQHVDGLFKPSDLFKRFLDVFRINNVRGNYGLVLR